MRSVSKSCGARGGRGGHGGRERKRLTYDPEEERNDVTTPTPPTRCDPEAIQGHTRDRDRRALGRAVAAEGGMERGEAGETGRER